MPLIGFATLLIRPQGQVCTSSHFIQYEHWNSVNGGA